MGNIVTVSVSRVSINVRRLQVILIGNMKTSGSLCECGYRDGDIYVQLMVLSFNDVDTAGCDF